MPSAVDLVRAIAQSLVDQPDKVEARWVESPEGGHVELKVADQDRGKVIGRRGRTIDSLRQLATAAFDKQVGVELLE